MDFDLERSLRFLEDSISKQGNLLVTTTVKTKDHETYSISEIPDKQRHSIHEKSFNAIIDENKSITGSVLRVNEPWKLTVNSLFVEFYEVLQSQTNSDDVFNSVGDMARCCTDALQVIKSLKEKSSALYIEEEVWLELERNTWRLLLALCQDRFITFNNCDVEPTMYFGNSEKMCVANLFKNDSIVRETQLVIDWLEFNAAEKDIDALHFSDLCYGWENTLHQLISPSTTLYSSKDMVKTLHPDVQWCQAPLTLHYLDVEDEKRLCRMVFQQIRCGKLEKAQELCVNSGHSWRAALFEGWRLYHEFTDEEIMGMEEDVVEISDVRNKYPPEGNAIRHVWKAAAYRYCSLDKQLNVFEKAAIAAFCGHLKALLRVSENWEDALWAYMKVLIDIRVESEIRDVISSAYDPLPEEYWDQRLSLNGVFEKLEESLNDKVKAESKHQMRVVQKYIILDDIPQLIDTINDWIKYSHVTTQFLRFVVHMVLVLEQIGKTDRDKFDNIIESYIARLADMNDVRLIAFYSSKLSSYKQTLVYACYLERILDNEERQNALSYAEDYGLNVHDVAKQVMENIKNRPHEISNLGNLQEKLNDTELLKISALDWLLLCDTTKLDAIEQANALIFSFLTLRKLDAAQLAFNKIPPAVVDEILSEDELEPNINQIIKDHLSYKAYLDAQEAFNEWYKQNKSKPIPPEEISENAQFTEKVAYEHRESQFRADTERWKLTTAHLAKNAKAKLYNVLLFPEGGWLNGAKDGHFLRSTCIPEVVLLLYSVLNESENYEECLQLADTIACEKYGLYKVFPKEKLRQFLKQLCNSSVVLLNQKKDAWGTIMHG